MFHILRVALNCAGLLTSFERSFHLSFHRKSVNLRCENIVKLVFTSRQRQSFNQTYRRPEALIDFSLHCKIFRKQLNNIHKNIIFLGIVCIFRAKVKEKQRIENGDTQYIEEKLNKKEVSVTVRYT